ncbi:MAG: hypothetical protein P9L91_08495, partial [Candidatus Zophobacter franzmannii]|nr:hypothetical protein [Candidatus Zophobacter franzmannii]
MLWLFLSIICSVAIANLLKLYQEKDKSAPILVIFFGNYLFAAIFSYLLAKPLPTDVVPKEIISGIVFGALFIISFFVYQRNIKVNGISLSVSIMRLSLLIPIILSVLAFGDRLNIVNFIGIAIVFTVFMVMGKQKDKMNILWLFLLFFTVGWAESGMKVFKEISSHSDAFFLTLVFTSAALIALTAALIQKKKVISKYLLWGVLLGIPNQLTAFFFMKSIDSIPAVIAYPTLAASVILGSIFTDAFIWKS